MIDYKAMFETIKTQLLTSSQNFGQFKSALLFVRGIL